MARANKRDEVLAAVVTIIERDGLRAVTLDAVATEIGMTRAGLLYHFPSREALMLATHKHLIDLFERDLETIAGKPAYEASEAERYAAYIKVSSKSATRAELLLMLESADDGQIGALWHDVMARWVKPAPQVETLAEIDALIARLAADGLWIHEAMSSHAISGALLKKITARLSELAGGRS